MPKLEWFWGSDAVDADIEAVQEGGTSELRSSFHARLQLVIRNRRQAPRPGRGQRKGMRYIPVVRDADLNWHIFLFYLQSSSQASIVGFTKLESDDHMCVPSEDHWNMMLDRASPLI